MWNPDGMGGTIYIPKIETTAVPAKSNPNTWRKKIGVGEHVGCALVYAPGGCTVEWSVAGAGCTIVPSGYNAELIAGDSETPAVVTAAFTKEAPSIAETELVTLNVVPPTGVTARKLAEGMANIPAEDAEDIHEIVVKGGVDIAAAGAYMRLKWHFLPDDVSFYRVKWREMFAPAQNPHGCYLLSPHGHPEGMIWNGIQTDNDQTTVDHVYEWKAASTSGPPWIWFGMNGGMMELGGEIEWNISWRWIVIDKADEHAMGPNLEHVSVTGDGTMTIEKLGQPATEPAHIYNSQP